MVRAPATNVNVTLFVSPRLVSPTAAIVALPFQVPAYAAGIVAPVVVGGGAVVCGAVAAGLLALPASELPPAGEAGGDPRVRSTTARTTAAAATAPPTARSGARRDRAGARPGPESPGPERPGPESPGPESSVGWCPGNVGPGGGYSGPVRGTESTRSPAGAAIPAAFPYTCGPGGVRGAVGSTRRSRRSRALGRRAGSLSRHSRAALRRDGGRPLTSGSSYMIRCMTAGTLSAPNASWPVAA